MEEKKTLHILLQCFKRDVSHLSHRIVLRMDQHHAVKRTTVLKISDADTTRGLLASEIKCQDRKLVSFYYRCLLNRSHNQDFLR